MFLEDSCERKLLDRSFSVVIRGWSNRDMCRRICWIEVFNIEESIAVDGV